MLRSGFNSWRVQIYIFFPFLMRRNYLFFFGGAFLFYNQIFYFYDFSSLFGAARQVKSVACRFNYFRIYSRAWRNW